jgi:flagellar motor protein MotB
VLATGNPGASEAGARLTLTRAGRTLLRRSTGGRRVDLVLTATGADGQTVTQTTTVVLRGLRANALTLAYRGRSATPSRGLRTQLHRVARALAGVPAVRCIADTDASGRAAADRALTRRQARNVCAALEEAGLTARRTAVGRGGDHPRASNRTAAGRAKNRRVTISVGR